MIDAKNITTLSKNVNKSEKLINNLIGTNYYIDKCGYDISNCFYINNDSPINSYNKSGSPPPPTHIFSFNKSGLSNHLSHSHKNCDVNLYSPNISLPISPVYNPSSTYLKKN